MTTYIQKTLTVLAMMSISIFSSSTMAYMQPALKDTDPAYVIQTTLDKIATFSSNSDRANPVELRVFIEKQIIPHFDFNNMAHWITGPYAHNMTEKDKTDFKRSLRETFLSSLAKHLGSYDAENTRFRIFPARFRGPDEAFVSTTVYRTDTPPVRLDFRMRRDGEGPNAAWKIIDVKANGSSAVLYYRRHFMSQLRQYRNPYPAPANLARPAPFPYRQGTVNYH